MRILYYVEIIHGKLDLGSLGEEVSQASQRIMGRQKTIQLQKQTENLWIVLKKEIEKLDLDYQKLVVFQDGLPDTEPQLIQRIIEEGAKKGSPNYLLLQKLKDKGATIVGTEDPKLLMEEYKMAQEEFKERNLYRQRQLVIAHRAKKTKLSRERDKFIAQKIDQNLTEGRVGIVFMGMIHKVKERLPSDIQVKLIDLIPLEVRSLFQPLL